VLTGTGAVNGAGNALANHIQGNSADNTLNGGGGADRLSGGAGNDTLIGGMGSDTMAGGSGDDTFVVDVSTDIVVELAGEGIDTVMSSVTLRLGDNVENLTLIGSNAINAGGNALDNVLTGNSASNQMAGGAGNDSYVVGSGDTVTEALGAGIDTVWSSVTWTLGNNLEHLTLTGNAAINGGGNALDNVLIGNSAANTLRGAAGSDIYDGRGGNDVLTDLSTTSGDVYRWGLGSGTDTVADSGGRDRVNIGAGITESQLTFARNGSNLELTVAGRTDKLIVSNWYLSAANQVEEFRLSDGNSVFASEIQSLVSAMAVFDAAQETTVDIGRETILPMQQPDPLWSVLAVM
jgi:Ca2+-binding RTX toxin-like protein